MYHSKATKRRTGRKKPFQTKKHKLSKKSKNIKKNRLSKKTKNNKKKYNIRNNTRNNIRNNTRNKKRKNRFTIKKYRKPLKGGGDHNNPFLMYVFLAQALRYIDKRPEITIDQVYSIVVDQNLYFVNKEFKDYSPTQMEEEWFQIRNEFNSFYNSLQEESKGIKKTNEPFDEEKAEQLYDSIKSFSDRVLDLAFKSNDVYSESQNKFTYDFTQTYNKWRKIDFFIDQLKNIIKESHQSDIAIEKLDELLRKKVPIDPKTQLPEIVQSEEDNIPQVPNTDQPTRSSKKNNAPIVPNTDQYKPEPVPELETLPEPQPKPEPIRLGRFQISNAY